MLLGAWELLVVAIAALLLLGPEKLPELMRTVARLASQAQRLVTEAKQSVSDVLNEEPDPKPPSVSEDRSRYEDPHAAPFSDWAVQADPQKEPAPPDPSAPSASPTAPPPPPEAQAARPSVEADKEPPVGSPSASDGRKGSV